MCGARVGLMLRSFTILLLAVNVSFGQLENIFGKLKGATESVAAKKIAYFKLRGELAETPPGEMPPLLGGEVPLSLKDLLERMKQARQDNAVVAVVVDLQNAAIGPGQIEELHAGMRKFAAVDKQVYVHADQLTTLTYVASTGASHVSLVPTGDLWLTGLYSEAPYLREMFEKMGCMPDFEHCGAYKSAAETFMRKEPSKESLEMTKWLFDGIYGSLVKLVAESRSMTPDKVRSIVDGGPYSAEEALKVGLIDSIQHRQDFVAQLKKKHGDDAKIVRDYGDSGKDMELAGDFFTMFGEIMELLNPTPKTFDKPTVAVVYVDGMIQTGEAEASPFGQASGAYSTTIRKALDKAADEDAVKAVVLRVDSPGGSALASEIILDATKRVKAKKKPLIVSMGNVAGSGGYYVSCGADAIFADAMTITASIGVVGGKLVTTGGWDKLGVNWHEHKRGENAGMLSSSAPFNERERAKFRKYMEDVYGIFKGHVTASRGNKLKKPIDEIAGGRVFTGVQALELGLVDKLGGFDDAVKFAADKAGMPQYDVRVIPEPPSIFELLMPQHDDEGETTRLSLTPGTMNSPLFEAILPVLSSLDPWRVRAVADVLQRIELVHREGAAMVMPEVLRIR